MMKRKLLAIVLFIASVISFYLTWFFIMDVSYPYSEGVKRQDTSLFMGILEDISLFMGIGFGISSFKVSKIGEGTFLWKVSLTLFFISVAIIIFTALRVLDGRDLPSEFYPLFLMSFFPLLGLWVVGLWVEPFAAGERRKENLQLLIIQLMFFGIACITFYSYGMPEIVHL